MKFLWSIARFTLRDHQRNEKYRHLKVMSISERITEYRQNWRKHIERMPENRIQYLL